jgi:general secretion pathway protein J
MIGRPPSPATRRRRARGFTLIELLVVLTLVGLMSVALFGGLRFGARVWQTGNERSDNAQQTVLVQHLLRRQLEQTAAAVPRPEEETGTEVDSGFAGTSDELTFTAALSDRFGYGGLYAFHLYTLDGHDGRHLMLDIALDRDDGPLPLPEEHEPTRVLLADIENVELRYYGIPDSERQGRGTQAGWYDSWEAETNLPRLISIEAGFREGDPRRWPRLLVAPRRTTSLADR